MWVEVAGCYRAQHPELLSFSSAAGMKQTNESHYGPIDREA